MIRTRKRRARSQAGGRVRLAGEQQQPQDQCWQAAGWSQLSRDWPSEIPDQQSTCRLSLFSMGREGLWAQRNSVCFAHFCCSLRIGLAQGSPSYSSTSISTMSCDKILFLITPVPVSSAPYVLSLCFLQADTYTVTVRSRFAACLLHFHALISSHVFGCFFFLRFCLFIHERHRKRGRDIGRGRCRLPVGSPTWNSIPGPQDHNLSPRQMLNH